MSFRNVYEDRQRAASYARLEFPGTYYLAFRDLPELIARHAPGRRALDFGCGAGRSTSFLRALGFDVLGVDISADMLALARERDPGGDYRLVTGDDLGALGNAGFDVILSAFTFDNVPGMDRKVALFSALAARLAPRGAIVNLVSSPEIYVNEWLSFTTRDFPANREARSGDVVEIVMLDVEDRRPVRDILWSDADYREVYRRAGLAVADLRRPLGRDDEPHAWVSETRIAPWTVWVLGRDNEASPEG